nr:putative capsid [Marmot picobirnavirus]
MSKQQNSNSNKRRTNNPNRRGSKPGRRDKKVEVSVEEKNINREDLPHIITNARSNNDPSWYSHIYPLLQDVASMPFSYPVGVSYDALNTPAFMTGDTMNSIDQVDDYAKVIPGIFTLELAPTCGIADAIDSAPNIAAQQLYTLVRKANSGNVNQYDKTDLMMMVMAMDSAYMLYEECIRAYKILGSYNYMSRYQPDDLLYALGFSPEIGRDMADFKAALDLFAYQLGSINVPDQFDFIHRHSWLFSHVYKDSEDSRAQLYAYVPAGFHVWTEGQEGKPTYLKYVPRFELYGLTEDSRYRVRTVDDLRTAINKIMQPILGSQDIGVMTGDLMKAFGEGGMINIQVVSDSEVMTPVYDMEVINQMMNANWYTVTTEYTHQPIQGLDIIPEFNNLVAGPYLTSRPYVSGVTQWSQCLACMKRLLNLKGMEGTPENVMVATRLMSYMSPDEIDQDPESTQANFPITTCGTEIAVRASIFTKRFPDSMRPFTPGDYPEQWILFQAMDAKNTSTALQLMLISAFDNAPTIYTFENYDANKYKFVNQMQDVNKYTWVSDSQTKRLNEVAIMSEFAVKDYKTGI